MKYIDVMKYENDRYPFQIIICGRGTGKSYSALRHCLATSVDDEEYPGVYEDICNDMGYLIPKGEPFIWMRRTDRELKALTSSNTMGDAGNPFRELNDTYGTNYGLHKVSDSLTGIYKRRTMQGKTVPIGECVGYGLALSTIATIRGLEFNHVKRVFYDEFIPERHVHRMKHEGEAILNAIETIGRNRELKGLAPLKVYFLSNSNNIYNPLLVELGLVNKVERMLTRGISDITISERMCQIHLLDPAEEFKTAKANTSLYNFAKGTNFSEMSLDNTFAYNDFSNTGYRNLKGYTPIVCAEDMYIYKKKGETEFYCTYSQARCPGYKTDIKVDKIAFQRQFRRVLMDAITAGKVWFETYDLKEKLLNILDIRDC